MTTAYAVRNPVTPKVNRKVARIAEELQRVQRKRSIVLKSRIMQANRMQAVVAGTIGYHANMSEKERTKKFAEASDLIEQIMDGERDDYELADVVRMTMLGVESFNTFKGGLEVEMKRLVRALPVHKWVGLPQQRGFGEIQLAVLIGETGDLANYSNPGKLWRRMGCAPYEKEGETLMGATWKSRSKSKTETKLHSEDWSEFGYSPRRRSIAYLIGEGIVKQNGSGPYRRRYDETKAKIKASHSDYSDQRCHRHGMLLATKLLLKNLWIEWNK